VTEQRKAPRKIFKVKAVLAMDGQEPVPARTTDISANGLCMTVPHPLQQGQTGLVAFDLLVEGTVVRMQLRCKVMYCIFGSGEFKAGFQFMNLDLNAITNITRFMR
jgi:hypothetical protein